MEATKKQKDAIKKMANALNENLFEITDMKNITIQEADKVIKKLIVKIHNEQDDLGDCLPDHIMYGGQD